jgi:hypothetical protein
MRVMISKIPHGFARTRRDGEIDAGTKDYSAGHPSHNTRNYVVDGPVKFWRLDEW